MARHGRPGSHTAIRKIIMAAVSLPFYIDDLDQLREKLSRAERDATLMGQVWTSVRRRARARPWHFPWFAPFVAMITGEEGDVENARDAIRRYAATFDALGFTAGLHFHFWCFAFPHARWSLFFQWLHSIGAWQPEEERRLAEQLVAFQFVNFFSGLRTKPEPECVDNQTMSLALSNGLVGHLFGVPPFGSAIARRMYDDGVRRLPHMIGGMPDSGYSGEGSTYQDLVVGPSMPLIVEFLERAEGGQWFARKLPPRGGFAESIVRMIAREWMPGGLLLPWDHYGYQLPCRSTVAYAARKTGDPWYLELLENHAGWSHDVHIGWGFDDLVWSLVWWPDAHRGKRPATTSGDASCRRGGKAFPSWCAPEIGAALVDDDAALYLMQMWDASTPECPSRAHVNPNAVILGAWGSPLTVDGVASSQCTAFNFDDTWREVGYMGMERRKFNFGSGCGGAHGVILVDGWEGLRAESSYRQAELLEFDEAAATVSADVTPVYRERWPDALRVVRRSRLCAGAAESVRPSGRALEAEQGVRTARFWLIEDLVAFRTAHAVTARWFFRPELVGTSPGVTIETAEGVRLRFLPLLGPDAKSCKTIEGYPDRLDGRSVLVDFTQRGTECRWLWLAWPEQTREEVEDLSPGWQVLADPGETLAFSAVVGALRQSELRLPFTRPAFMLADLPVVRRWWYRRRVKAPTHGRWWLRLPRQLGDARLWVNGTGIDLQPHRLRMALLAPHVEMPAMAGEAEVVVQCTANCSQHESHGDLVQSFEGRPAVLIPRHAPCLEEAAYRHGVIVIRTPSDTWRIPHHLLTLNDSNGEKA